MNSFMYISWDAYMSSRMYLAYACPVKIFAADPKRVSQGRPPLLRRGRLWQSLNINMVSFTSLFVDNNKWVYMLVKEFIDLRYHNGDCIMKLLIIAAVLTVVGVYVYFSRANQRKLLDNHGRRSGMDRRKAFIGSKNQMRRSDKERRQSSDRRREPRFAQ